MGNKTEKKKSTFNLFHFVLGFILAIMGVAVVLSGVYFAIVQMFIGGIIEIINEIKAENTGANVVAWAIAKIIFAQMAGGLIAWLGVLLTMFGVFLAKHGFNGRQHVVF